MTPDRAVELVKMHSKQDLCDNVFLKAVRRAFENKKEYFEYVAIGTHERDRVISLLRENMRGIAFSVEADNALAAIRIYPREWRKPVTDRC